MLSVSVFHPMYTYDDVHMHAVRHWYCTDHGQIDCGVCACADAGIF
jgi:hypothetical protein